MKRAFTLIEVLVIVAIVGILAAAAFTIGCAPEPKPEPISTAELLAPRLKAITDRLDAIDAKLDKLAQRRIIFPSLGDKPEMAAPDIRAAVGHSLMAAADLCGRDKVVGFFRDMVGEIVSKRIPIDVGGAVKAKCQADATEKINSLLTQ